MRRYACTCALLVLALAVPLAHDALAEPPRRQRTAAFDDELLERQYQALVRLSNRVDVTYTARGAVRRVEGDTGYKLEGLEKLAKGDRAPQVVQVLAGLLMARGTEELAVWSTMTIPGEQTFVFKQSIRGLPVVHGGGVSIAVNTATGTVRILHSHFVPDHTLPRTPAISKADATERAIAFVAQQEQTEENSAQVHDEPTLAYYGGGPDGDKSVLVWAVEVGYLIRDNGGSKSKAIWVDAVTGAIVGEELLTFAALNRSVYTAHGVEVSENVYPSGLTLLFTEGNPSGSDVHALTAYQLVQTSYQAWNSGFGRDYAPAGIVVHWGNNSILAGYKQRNGINWLSFGDGHSLNIAPSLDLDTVAHEYGHGIFDQFVLATSLLPMDDDLAVKEGYADFSSVFVASSMAGHVEPPAASVWQIMEVQLPAPPLPMRSWSNPRVANYQSRDWYTDRSTPSEEHNNSSVMAHALYLLSQGGQHARVGGATTVGPIPAISVPGVGFNKMKNILYAAFGYPGMESFPTYSKLKAAMEDRASLLYGSSAKDSVTLAWNAVGVGHDCSAAPATPSIWQTLNCPFWTVGLGYTPQATHYQIQYSLGPTFLNPWVGADGPVAYCEVYSNVTIYARGRTCNGCGCSPWSYNAALTPWQGDCP